MPSHIESESKDQDFEESFPVETGCFQTGTQRSRDVCALYFCVFSVWLSIPVPSLFELQFSRDHLGSTLLDGCVDKKPYTNEG
jgi:hypothetical protein